MDLEVTEIIGIYHALQKSKISCEKRLEAANSREIGCLWTVEDRKA